MLSEVVLEQISGVNCATRQKVQTRVWRVRYNGIFVGIKMMDVSGPIHFIVKGLREDQREEIIAQVSAIMNEEVSYVEAPHVEPREDEEEDADFE